MAATRKAPKAPPQAPDTWHADYRKRWLADKEVKTARRKAEREQEAKDKKQRAMDKEQARKKKAEDRENAKKATAAKKEARTKAAAAKKAADREDKARKKAEDKAKKAAELETSRKAKAADKQRARAEAKIARKQAQKEKELAQAAASSSAKSAMRASSAQARTVSMHKGVEPAPAVEAASLDPDLLILLPEGERKKLLALAGKSQRKLLARELSQMARKVRGEIRALKAVRRQRLRVLKSRAKDGLAVIRRRIVEVRTRYLQEMQQLRAEKAETMRGRKTGVEEVNTEIGAALGSASARGKAIKDTKSEIKAMRAGPTDKQLAAAKQRREAREESDGAVANELEKALPGAEKWWRAEGHKQSRFAPKKVPQKMSRAEHVMHALHNSPQILDDFFEKKAAAALKLKEAENKALSKRLARKEIQRGQRATRRYGQIRPRGPSRGRGLEAPAPFLSSCLRSVPVHPWGSILVLTSKLAFLSQPGGREAGWSFFALAIPPSRRRSSKRAKPPVSDSPRAYPPRWQTAGVVKAGQPSSLHRR